MSRSTRAATAANLSAMIAAGFPAPVGLTDTVATIFAPPGDPETELISRLGETTGGRAQHDAQSEGLRALAAQLTFEQVRDVLVLTPFPAGFSSTRLWACVRDGLLPHDSRIVSLFTGRAPQGMRMKALEEALAQDASSGCSYRHLLFRQGKLSKADLVESGHGTCTPLTRDDVLDAVKDMDLPLTERIGMLFDRPSWSGARRPGPQMSADPQRAVSRELLERLHDLIERELTCLGAHSPEWVQAVTWFLHTDQRQLNALTDDQVTYLLTERPGLASDLLVRWLGTHVDGLAVRMMTEHVLVFLPFGKPMGMDRDEWDAWVGELVDAGHPAVAAMDNDHLARYVLAPGKLTTVPWSLRRRVLARRSDWRAAWLTDHTHPADPAEVRELADAGEVSPPTAVYAYVSAPPAVRSALLEVRGLAAYVAELLGEQRALHTDIAKVSALLTGVLDLMPAADDVRTRLMMRVLTAAKEGPGPLDGDVSLVHGLAVITARWAAKEARLSGAS